MKFITLTMESSDPVRINIRLIGHYFPVVYTDNYRKVDKRFCTRVGVLTHNNGGFDVKETPEEIDVLIQQAK
jgi:hypothetical protein